MIFNDAASETDSVTCGAVAMDVAIGERVVFGGGLPAVLIKIWKVLARKQIICQAELFRVCGGFVMVFEEGSRTGKFCFSLLVILHAISSRKVTDFSVAKFMLNQYYDETPPASQGLWRGSPEWLLRALYATFHLEALMLTRPFLSRQRTCPRHRFLGT